MATQKSSNRHHITSTLPCYQVRTSHTERVVIRAAFNTFSSLLHTAARWSGLAPAHVPSIDAYAPRNEHIHVYASAESGRTQRRAAIGRTERGHPDSNICREHFGHWLAGYPVVVPTSVVEAEGAASIRTGGRD